MASIFQSINASIFIIVTLICFALGSDYCALTPNHIRCIGTKSCETCNKYKYVIEQKKDKEELLRELNLFRSKVAGGTFKQIKGPLYPKASNMMQLEWDAECEAAALNVARRGYGSESCCTCNLLDRFETNYIFFGSSAVDSESGFNWSVVINSLTNYGGISIDHIKNYPSTHVFYNSSDQITKFALLIRAELNFVGCSYRSMKQKTKNFFGVLFCVFGGVSKYYNAPVYKQGEPCSSCPFQSTRSPEFANLCKCASGKCYHEGRKDKRGYFCQRSSSENPDNHRTSAHKEELLLLQAQWELKSFPETLVSAVAKEDQVREVVKEEEEVREEVKEEAD